ncbi:MAG: type II toxin-antitoxin system RelE/ParE family toxin [Methanomicrobiales archaeon]
MYRIVLTRRAEKDLAAIPQEHRIRIENALERFAASPGQRHDIVKVKDSPRIVPRYRLRIGEYRATFYMHHDVLIIEILTVGKKKNFSY